MSFPPRSALSVCVSGCCVSAMLTPSCGPTEPSLTTRSWAEDCDKTRACADNGWNRRIQTAAARYADKTSAFVTIFNPFRSLRCFSSSPWRASRHKQDRSYPMVLCHTQTLSFSLSLLPSLSRSLSLARSRCPLQTHTNTHTVPLSQTAGRALPPSEREARPEMQPGAGSYSSYNLTFVQS